VQLHPKEVVQLQWTNIGTRPARRGTATIFTFVGGKRQTKLGDTEIARGYKIMPGSVATISMDFNSEQLNDGLLACVLYRDDDDKKHKQAFIYHQKPPQDNLIYLSELTPPRYNAVCR
jgi:hypothetical protein